MLDIFREDKDFVWVFSEAFPNLKQPFEVWTSKLDRTLEKYDHTKSMLSSFYIWEMKDSFNF